MPIWDVTSGTASAPIDRLTLNVASVRSDAAAEPTGLGMACIPGGAPLCFDASDE